MFRAISLGLLSLCFVPAVTVYSHPQAPSDGPQFLDQPASVAIKHMGYQVESYDVKSLEPGYIITLHRMINPYARRVDLKRAVLFDHGVGQDSLSEFLSFSGYARAEKPTAESYSKDIYLNATDELDERTQEPTEATYKKMCLACLFANNNYDVYLMDDRGSSRGSTRIDEDELKRRGGKKIDYWDFSADEQFMYDLPAVIDFVRNATGLEKISYVGYSLGTIEMFGLLALHNESAEKLETVVAIAPIFYVNNVRGVLPLTILTDPLLRNANFADTLNYDIAVLINRLVSVFCAPSETRLTLCKSLFELLVGPDPKQYNILTDAFLSHFIEPNSIKTFVQIGQLMKTDKLQGFEHGNPEKNFQEYNSTTPIYVTPRQITLKKLILVRSEGNDYLSTKLDQRRFIKELAVPIFEDIVVPPEYNHLGFVLGKTSFTTTNGPIIRAVNRAYETKTSNTKEKSVKSIDTVVIDTKKETEPTTETLPMKLIQSSVQVTSI